MNNKITNKKTTTTKPHGKGKNRKLQREKKGKRGKSEVKQKQNLLKGTDH